MHSTSSLWKQLLDNPDHWKVITLRIAGIEYQAGEFQHLEVSFKMFDTPTVGKAVARQIDLTFLPKDVIPRLAMIELFVALTDGETTSERIPKGVFFIDTRSTDTETGWMTIHGFDAVMMMEQAMYLESNKCRVVFDVGANKRTYNLAIGTPTPTIEVPRKDGARFAGWTPPLDAAVVRSITYTAVWEYPETVAIIYDTGDGSPQTILALVGDPTPTIADPEKDNARFAGWTPPLEETVQGETTYTAMWEEVDAKGRYYGGAVWYSKNGVVTITGTGDQLRAELYQQTLPDNTARVIIESGITSVGSCAFIHCENLVDVTIPDGVTGIGTYAFSGCESLSGIVIPDGVTYIDMNAFAGCKNLAEVTLPNSVMSIGNAAFANCESLVNIVIPNHVNRIGIWAFAACLQLASIVIPSSITTIESYSFTSCFSLSNIVIPASVTRIQARAFEYDDSLLDIYYGGTQGQWRAAAGQINTGIPEEATIHFNSNGQDGA